MSLLLLASKPLDGSVEQLIRIALPVKTDRFMSYYQNLKLSLWYIGKAKVSNINNNNNKFFFDHMHDYIMVLDKPAQSFPVSCTVL